MLHMSTSGQLQSHKYMDISLVLKEDCDQKLGYMPTMFSILYYILVNVPVPVSFTICGTVLVSVAVFIQSLICRSNSTPKLHYKDSTLAKYLLKRVKWFSFPYRSPWGMRNAHVQTILAKLMSYLPSDDVTYHRQYIQMKDKGVVSIDWVHLAEAPSSGRNSLHKHSSIVIIIPSLYSGRRCITSLCKRALQKGFRPVVFNKRGHGNSYLTTARLQSFGDVSDLRETVRYIHSVCPHSLITAAAISFDGSGLLFSYLGEYGSSCLITGSVCISPGYDAEVLLNQSLPQPYHFLFLLQHKRHLAKHAKPLEGSINITDCMKSKTLSDLEQSLYGNLYGYKNTSSYWEKNNPMRDVDDISTPVLCINSLDDPISVQENIPHELFEFYPNFMLVTTENGGHCGFLEGKLNKLQSWSDKTAIDYLTAVIEFMDKYESNNKKR